MLATPNCQNDRVYPVWLLPCGGDGKRKPFHVVHCLAQPTCENELRLSPGKHSQLPPECVAKFAEQKGWMADKKGYALCPDHNPRNRRNGSTMPPGQKRAAFMAIRDRNLAAAAERMLRPSKPVGSLPKEVAAVRAKVEAARERDAAAAMASKPSAHLTPAEAETVTKEAKSPAMVEFANRLLAAGISRPLAAALVAVLAVGPAKIFPSRRAIAESAWVNIWTFNDALKKAIRLGLVVQEPVRPGTSRPFRLRLPDQFDPPAMQPDQPEDSAMNEEAVVSVPKAEPPPQPTREHNRRIRDFLDSNYDEGAGRYCGDLSDQKAAERLKVPRAWVAAVRHNLYGDDRNEADELVAEQASALEARAAELERVALDLATKAEALGRDVRQFQAGRHV